MENKLITLSAYVDNANLAMGEMNMSGTYHMEKEAFAQLSKICNWNDFLKRTLTLGDFIPCKDGKPLEKPEYYDNWDGEAVNPVDHTDYIQSLYDYQEAKSRVVFEGWEIVSNNKVICSIRNRRFSLTYNAKRKDFALKRTLQFLGFVPTFSDLAAATQDNPLKLKDGKPRT